MSGIRGHIATHDGQRSARYRAVLRIRSLWSDAAENKLERNVLEELDQQDRGYAAALAEVDAEFDRAAKLLG